jgi:hypothetical protein
MPTRVLGIGAAVALVAVGCNREPRTETTTTTSAEVTAVENGVAIERIVNARCQRMAACGRLGLTATPDEGTCRNALRPDMTEGLRGAACPPGIDPQQLDRCLSAIREERCGNIAGSVVRLATCAPSELCRLPDVPR